MKLVFLIGDAAVGKMTVGQELMKITDLRLFHNHMTIEPVIVAFFIYFLLSTIFLANLKSIYKNLLSTILIVIIGILIWVIALSHGINVSNGYLLNSELWQLYAIYNMYSSLFLDESGINNQYLFLLFSFLPMISMALGLLLKQGVAKDK